MLKNYLLVSFRNLTKHLSYSVINIVGLGLGLATCLLLVTWVRHELSYDRFHANADHIYRGSLEYSFGGQTSKTSVSPTILLPIMKKNFAEVETGVRFYNPSYSFPYILRKGDSFFQENHFYYADSTFFDLFNYKLLEGNSSDALVHPNSVVLTQRMATKYFNNEPALGKLINVNDGADYVVTGIMENPPDNSSYPFDFIASFSSLNASHQQIWWTANYQTFIQVRPDANIDNLIAKTNALVKKELASELTNPGDYVKYNFIKLTDIHLRSDMVEGEGVGNIDYVVGFGAIAALLLVIACINYINLATAKAAERAREVGIRKVVGALRRQLFFQFIGESVVITFLAFLLAFLLAQLTLPLFNELTAKHFTGASLTSPSFLAYCFIGLLLISFVAGAYPSIAISAFKPVSVLKGTFKSSGRGIWLRQSLVVFQFCMSLVLIVSTIVITNQLDYLQNKKLGYDKDNVMMLSIDNKMEALYPQLRQALLQSGKVSQIGRATKAPNSIRGGYSINLRSRSSDQGMIVTAMTADTTFVPTLGMEIISGKNFGAAEFAAYQADTTVSFILNEAAVKALMLTNEKAIGTAVDMNGRKGNIVGVVRNFHFATLHQAITPMILFNENDEYYWMFLKLNPGNTKESILAIKNIVSQLLPHRPFEYEFLDQEYGAMYRSEERMGLVNTVFAALAIIIACLGLFGLVAFSASQKTKEIGVRKVMGATVTGIVFLITRDYARLLVISIVLGLPLAYWIIEKWFLGSFAYRIPLGASPFVLAAVSSLVIAFVTASYQAIRAARVNPTESLRNE